MDFYFNSFCFVDDVVGIGIILCWYGVMYECVVDDDVELWCCSCCDVGLGCVGLFVCFYGWGSV